MRVTIEARTEQNKGRALFIEFENGRADLGDIAQLIMLGPGTYEFKGQYKGDIVGRRGLVWRITCAGSNGAKIGQSAMLVGATSNWKDFGFRFTIPDNDCRAQHVRLMLTRVWLLSS